MTLTDDITRDLTQRIRTVGAAPEQWTLTALATEFGVSATPIRLALARLVDSGLVVREPNGRLLAKRRARSRASSYLRSPDAAVPLAAVPLAAPQATPQATPLAETVEREVLRKSLRGEHAFLREEAFAVRLGVGRTRLRRVLHELAGAGVIEHVERRGFRARPFHRDDMLAFLDVRAALEVQALDLAKAQLTNADLARFLQGNDAAAIARRSIDNGLHAYFVLKSNNHYLSAFFASHGRYYARLFDFATVDSNRLAEMAGQHTEILKHAMARRWARARTVLRHHIHSQAPVLGAVMDQLEAHPELTTSND